MDGHKCEQSIEYSVFLFMEYWKIRIIDIASSWNKLGSIYQQGFIIKIVKDLLIFCSEAISERTQDLFCHKRTHDLSKGHKLKEKESPWKCYPLQHCSQKHKFNIAEKQKGYWSWDSSSLMDWYVHKSIHSRAGELVWSISCQKKKERKYLD